MVESSRSTIVNEMNNGLDGDSINGRVEADLDPVELTGLTGLKRKHYETVYNEKKEYGAAAAREESAI